jgi:hypothetical protein
MNSSENKNCPCCGRHCGLDDLHCERGRAYFGVNGGAEERNHHPHFHAHGREDMTIDDKLISLLRDCGHYLHHAEGGHELTAGLSDEDKKELIMLLKKCMINARH